MGPAHLVLSSSISACPLTVGDPHHADRLRKHCVHNVLSVIRPPFRLHVIDTVPLWDCTDLLPLWIFRLQSLIVLICDAIWKGDVYEVLNKCEFPVALHSCALSYIRFPFECK